MFAQTESATVRGSVSDTTGALLSQAKVLLIDIDRGTQVETESNASGFYTFAGVHPGRYRMEVEKSGFKVVHLVDVVVNVQDNLEENFRLDVGAVSESLTVTAGAATVNTTDASVSTVIDRQFVENLPLNGRSFQSLLFLTPGVTINQNIVGNQGDNVGGFVVSGQRGDQNYWIVDGVSASIATTVSANQGPGVGGTLAATNVMGGTNALVSVDAMQEFRIETSTYAPEFGRLLGGQISIQTRSGTNQFHGALFDYVRNGILDATDWFASNHGIAKAIEKQNDFGGVIGGPIVKNKTFFFFSFEGFRLRLPGTFLGTVPDLAARQAAIPAMQPYLNAYPLPQPGAQEVSPGLVLYAASYSNPTSADAYSIRVDHQLAKNLNLFGRYNEAPSSSPHARGGIALSANTLEATYESTRTATVGAAWSRSTIVNDARFNYSSSGGHARYFEDTFGGGTTIPAESVFPSGYTYKNAWIAFDTTFGSNNQFIPGYVTPAEFQHQYNAVDTVAMQKGTHSLKFGVDYRHLSPVIEFAPYILIPIFGSLTDMQNGNTAVTIVINNLPSRVALNNFSAFAQDTWRVTPRLNLTYGLRWDVDFSPTSQTSSKFRGLTGFSTTDLSNLALGPVGSAPYGTRYGNFAPRIGGAYQLSQNPDWGLVLRGGFGVFYGLASTEVGLIGTYPASGVAVFGGAPFPTPPNMAALPPLVDAPTIQNGQTLSGVDPHLNLPYALQWNVALEQSLGKAQTLTMSYIGASDKRLLETESVTNLPNFVSASLVGNAGTLSYNALQAQYRRALTNGLQALVSYTWSHAIDTGSYGSYTNGSFANVNVNRGSSDYDLRQVFSMALTYNVPGVKSNTIARAITSGWSTHNVVQVHSAPPVDLTDARFTGLSRQNTSVLIRPDVVPGQPLYLYGSQYPGGKALNPAAFTDPPVDPVTGFPTRQGDLRRNVLRAFGLTEWDFAVHREFTIHEAVKLQFSAELFNVLNHPNFGLFNNIFQPGNVFFGQSTSMQNQLGGNVGWGEQSSLYASGGPRSTQMSLKLVF
jgi:hypothetical protein